MNSGSDPFKPYRENPLSNTHYPALSGIDAIRQAFESAGYICTTRIATVVRLAAALEKPVLIEGPPGVGKTELAKTCAMVVDRPLVRLQCYEGLDESKALYEWKYGKQLLYLSLIHPAVKRTVGRCARWRQGAQ